MSRGLAFYAMRDSLDPPSKGPDRFAVLKVIVGEESNGD